MNHIQLRKKIVVVICILLFTTPVLPLVLAGEPSSLRTSSIKSSSPALLSLDAKDAYEAKDWNHEDLVSSHLSQHPLLSPPPTYDHIFDVNPNYPHLPQFGLFNTIQSALDHVNNVSGSVHIRVSAHTYNEYLTIPSNREIWLQGDNTVLLGNPASGNTIVTIDTPHPLFRMTSFTINGNNANRGIILQNYVDMLPSYTHPVLSDLHITDCFIAGHGGGMYIVDSEGFLITNITVSDCFVGVNVNNPEGNGAGIAFERCHGMKLEDIHIDSCLATDNGGGMYFFECYPCIGLIWGFSITNCQTVGYGGGICIKDSEYIFLAGYNQPYPPQDSLITSCSASNGGGIALINSFYWSQCSGLTIHDVNVIGNEAMMNGGGLYGNIPVIVTCRSSDITGNTAQNGGGIYLANGGNLYTIYGTRLSGNIATYQGGGVYGDYIYYCIASDLGTTAYITNNTANHGGGIYLTTSTIAFNGFGYGGIGHHIFITGNQAITHGGGLYLHDCYPGSYLKQVRVSQNSARHGAGIYLYEEQDLTIINTYLTQNTAQYTAGGLCCKTSAPTLQQLTIAGNTALSGSALYVFLNDQVHLSDSIIWGNNNEQIHGDVIASYSDIQGGFSGLGNINQDPCFANPVGDDYALYQTSPCIDAGNPASPDDIDGTRADIGAYTATRETYLFEGGITNWKSFPLLHPAITALQFFTPLIQEGSLLEVRNDEGRRLYYKVQLGQWVDEIGILHSEKGYKVRITTLPPGQQYTNLDCYGYPLDPATVIKVIGSGEQPTSATADTAKENWLGYFLPTSTHVKTALASVMQYLSFIQTTDLLMVRTTPGGTWQINGTQPLLIDSGDMVVVKCYTTCQFTWNTNGKSTDSL